MCSRCELWWCYIWHKAGQPHHSVGSVMQFMSWLRAASGADSWDTFDPGLNRARIQAVQPAWSAASEGPQQQRSGCEKRARVLLTRAPLAPFTRKRRAGAPGKGENSARPRKHLLERAAYCAPGSCRTQSCAHELSLSVPGIDS